MIGETVPMPREPTQAMLDAAWQATISATNEQRMMALLGTARKVHDEKMRMRYRAMVDAAKVGA